MVVWFYSLLCVSPAVSKPPLLTSSPSLTLGLNSPMRGWIFPKSAAIPPVFCCFDSSAPRYSALYSSNSFMICSPGENRMHRGGQWLVAGNCIHWMQRGGVSSAPHIPTGCWQQALSRGWLRLSFLCFSFPAPGDDGERGVWAPLPPRGLEAAGRG